MYHKNKKLWLQKFGKKQGGDITSNKKTFLLIHALQVGSPAQVAELKELMRKDDPDKITRVLDIYIACDVPNWATELKQKYMSAAMEHLEEIAVLSARKKPLEELAHYLLDRQT